LLWNKNECGIRLVNEKSRQPTPAQIMIVLKQPENVEYFKYVDNITNDARYS